METPASMHKQTTVGTSQLDHRRNTIMSMENRTQADITDVTTVDAML